jgi:hypothetical protein
MALIAALFGDLGRMKRGSRFNTRLRALYFIGAPAVTAILLSGGAQSLPANHQWTAHAQPDNQAIQQCPPGYDWEPAGYLPGGIWHPARCVSRGRIEGEPDAY